MPRVTVPQLSELHALIHGSFLSREALQEFIGSAQWDSLRKVFEEAVRLARTFLANPSAVPHEDVRLWCLLAEVSKMPGDIENADLQKAMLMAKGILNQEWKSEAWRYITQAMFVIHGPEGPFSKILPEEITQVSDLVKLNVALAALFRSPAYLQIAERTMARFRGSDLEKDRLLQSIAEGYIGVDSFENASALIKCISLQSMHVSPLAKLGVWHGEHSAISESNATLEKALAIARTERESIKKERRSTLGNPSSGMHHVAIAFAKLGGVHTELTRSIVCREIDRDDDYAAAATAFAEELIRKGEMAPSAWRIDLNRAMYSEHEWVKVAKAMIAQEGGIKNARQLLSEFRFHTQTHARILAAIGVASKKFTDFEDALKILTRVHRTPEAMIEIAAALKEAIGD